MTNKVKIVSEVVKDNLESLKERKSTTIKRVKEVAKMRGGKLTIMIVGNKIGQSTTNEPSMRKEQSTMKDHKPRRIKATLSKIKSTKNIKNGKNSNNSNKRILPIFRGT